MIERIKKSWRRFASSHPGHRFRDRYRYHQSKGRGRFHPVKLFYIFGGLTLIVLSALFGWLPVLGWGTAFLGLGMIAGEFKPAARLMDWGEVRARKLFRPVGKAFLRLPTWAQLLISVTIAVLTFLLVYWLYSMTLGG
ncbi:MAG: hypothetical protein ACRDSJ_12865 [Rubrobacteraceae bacterium]